MRMEAYRRSVALEALGAADVARQGGRYGADRGGPRWRALGLIVALHAAGLYALIALDVIHVTRVKAPPTVVTLLPDDVPPPPPASPQPAPPVPAAVQIVAPPPVVTVQMPPSPATVQTVAVPPPAPAPVAVAAPAAGPSGPVGEAVVPPDFAGDQLGNAAPKYPIDSRRKREQGTVIVRVTVSASGEPGDCRVRTSSGFERLDKAAMQAVCRWRFSPATRGGQPVAWPMDVPIPFVLRG
ncbi:energy transducer TonB [Sphingomonas quercus]|uniref:Energy transducer TonB n=1 Tax=Sphingomonas quercus TaxID=2842451 RepID=A0ABS6BKF0_9SPHN|nr:energy transducer TonB [Sphingomonas quercus]MBU3078296.1 energy transducer TonB [Sphingomonas quercus]